MPQMVAQFPPMIETMVNMRTMILTMHSTMSGIFDQMDEMSDNAMAMGHAFDASKNDDSFYLPPQVFKNAEFKRAMNSFLSPDGHAARFIILHRGDPASAAGHRAASTRSRRRPRNRSRGPHWRTPRSTSPARGPSSRTSPTAPNGTW